VQFSDVAFYQTPADQSGNLTTNGTLSLTGNYGFIDANNNGISDAWEKYYFGSASNARTQTTDSDGDGMSDYAEFIAGTDPTNPASKLVFLGATLQSSNRLQFEWAAIPGRLYQVVASSVLSPPKLPRLSGSDSRVSGNFSLHVDAPANVTYAIQVSTNLALWSSVFTNRTGGNLDWLDTGAAHSSRRFYRTLVLSGISTNAQSWTAASDWLQASSSPMYYTTTNAYQGAHFYRVQVRP
jgi:hypothetical protein